MHNDGFGSALEKRHNNSAFPLPVLKRSEGSQTKEEENKTKQGFSQSLKPLAWRFFTALRSERQQKGKILQKKKGKSQTKEPQHTVTIYK